MLFGKNIPIINQLSSDFAYMGMGVVPSLLLHTAILFLLESGWKIKKKIMVTIITIIYLPVIPLTLTAVRIIFFLIFQPLSKRNNIAVCKSRLGTTPIPMYAKSLDN